MTDNMILTKEKLSHLVSELKKYREHYDECPCIAEKEINIIFQIIFDHHDDVEIDYESYIYFTYTLFYSSNQSFNFEYTFKRNSLQKRILDFSETKMVFK